MEQQVFDFMERLKKCSEFEQCWKAYLKELNSLGIVHALYGIILDIDDSNSNINDNFFFVSNYPEGFIDSMGGEGLWDHDFATEWCSKSTQILSWEDIEKNLSMLTPLQKKANDISLDYKFVEGFAIPLRTCGGMGVGGVGLSATGINKKEYKKDITINLPHIELITMLFHSFAQGFPKFTKQQRKGDRILNLTPLEIEVLTKLGQGHVIKNLPGEPGLEVSLRTIESALKSAKNKLNAKNKEAIMAKLMICGVLSPDR